MRVVPLALGLTFLAEPWGCAGTQQGHIAEVFVDGLCVTGRMSGGRFTKRSLTWLDRRCDWVLTCCDGWVSEHGSEHATSIVCRARQFTCNGNPSKAAEMLERARAETGNHPLVLRSLGQAYRAVGGERLADACRLLREAVNAVPLNIDYYEHAQCECELAEALAAQGRKAEANDAWKRACRSLQAAWTENLSGTRSMFTKVAAVVACDMPERGPPTLMSGEP